MDDEILTPKDVADLFKVTPKTVKRWATAGMLPSFKTAGGHARFKRADVDELIKKSGTPTKEGEL